MSLHRIIHRGWQVSPYTAKTRAYLKYKQIVFDDVESPLHELWLDVRPKVGKAIMPTVELRSSSTGSTSSVWLQDSSAIIDYFEMNAVAPVHHTLLFPPVVISSPPSFSHPKSAITSSFISTSEDNHDSISVARVASALLELLGDEFLVAAALHYRWGRGDAPYNFALTEFARCGLPFLPRSMGRLLVSPVGAKMRGYMPIMGINNDTAKGIEKMTDTMLASLEAQLEMTNAFLFGDKPCIGDFALYGPLWAHLYRDGGAPDLWVNRPNVLKWMERLTSGSISTPSSSSSSSSSPSSSIASISKLAPVFNIILEDSLPYSRELVRRIDEYCNKHPNATRLPRSLGTLPTSYGGVQSTRKSATSHQWKVQRVDNAYTMVGKKGQLAVDRWLKSLSGKDISGREVIPAVNNPIGRTESFKEVLANRHNNLNKEKLQ